MRVRYGGGAKSTPGTEAAKAEGGGSSSGGGGVFPTVFEKTRPEMDWRGWLAEEEAVAAAAAKRD